MPFNLRKCWILVWKVWKWLFSLVCRIRSSDCEKHQLNCSSKTSLGLSMHTTATRRSRDFGFARFPPIQFLIKIYNYKKEMINNSPKNTQVMINSCSQFNLLTWFRFDLIKLAWVGNIVDSSIIVTNSKRSKSFAEWVLTLCAFI